MNMTIEIVDYKNRKVYCGKDGFTIITSKSFMISSLKTEDEIYVTEMAHFGDVQFKILTTDSLDRTMSVIQKWLPIEDKAIMEKLEYKGYHRYNCGAFKYTLKELASEFISANDTVEYEHLDEEKSSKQDFINYSQNDVEAMKMVYEATKEDVKNSTPVSKLTIKQEKVSTRAIERLNLDIKVKEKELDESNKILENGNKDSEVQINNVISKSLNQDKHDLEILKGLLRGE